MANLTSKNIYILVFKSDPTKLYHFTTLAGIYELFSEKAIGVKLYQLWKYRKSILGGNDFVTSTCIIKVGTLYSKGHENG